MMAISARQSRDDVEAANKILNGQRISDYAPPCTQDPEAWFPGEEDRKARAAAKKGCGACEIKFACLEGALAMEGSRTSHTRFGIWGGLDEGQRDQLSRQRRGTP